MHFYDPVSGQFSRKGCISDNSGQNGFDNCFHLTEFAVVGTNLMSSFNPNTYKQESGFQKRFLEQWYVAVLVLSFLGFFLFLSIVMYAVEHREKHQFLKDPVVFGICFLPL